MHGIFLLRNFSYLKKDNIQQARTRSDISILIYPGDNLFLSKHLSRQQAPKRARSTYVAIFFYTLINGRDQACVSQNSRKLSGPGNFPIKLPNTISGVSQSIRSFRTREKSRNFLPPIILGW